MSLILAALIALVALAAAMGFAFWLTERTGRSGYADGVWSLSTGFVCAIMALVPQGYSHPRGLLVACLCAVWGLRLGGHILTRSHTGDDPRYAALRREWGEAAPRRMFMFLQSQAVAGWILSLCAMAAASSALPLGLGDVAGLVLALFALAGERQADRQLAAFRAEGKGGICERGWWARSRHPNYFFEWLWWCAIGLIGLSSGALPGAFALIAPAVMYYLLVHVSGVPPLEAHMLASRGEAFAAYQRRVPAFFPRVFQPRESHDKA